MKHFSATLDTKETADNVRAFVNQNMPIFWDIFKPLIPYILALIAVDFAVSFFILGIDPETGEFREFSLGSIIASYFFSCLIISWHRVVLDGPDRYVPMNPLKPQKSEWAFIGMGIFVFMIPFLTGLIGGIVVGFSGINILAFFLIPLLIFSIYLTIKFVFYFPSKATGNTITLRQSYSMTHGYVWKMLSANIRAAFKLFLIMIGYIIIGLVTIGIIGVASGVTNANGDDINMVGVILGVLFTIPVTFYFQPLFTIIGVTVLSNYYQHALQNKPMPEKTLEPPSEGTSQDMSKARQAMEKEDKET